MLCLLDARNAPTDSEVLCLMKFPFILNVLKYTRDNLLTIYLTTPSIVQTTDRRLRECLMN